MHYASKHNGLFGKEVIHLQECPSTNDYAKTFFKSGILKNGQVIITDFQSSGRGRSGSSWEAEPGKNLLLSLFLEHKNLDVSKQYLLNMSVSLAIKDTLEKFAQNIDFKVKWPNDIYFGDKKVSGILIENFLSSNTLEQSIIGIGINVNQQFFNTPNASSLFQICRYDNDIAEVFSVLMSALEVNYNSLINNDIEGILNRYNDNLYWKNEMRHFKSNSNWKGVIRGCDDNGRLLIEKDGKLSSFAMNEVTFLN